MNVNGHNFATTPPGAADSLACRVCGEAMAVSRDCFGPTGYASALAGPSAWTRHDEFHCRHSDEDWHRQALRLRQDAVATPSRTLEKLLEQEVREVLATRKATKRVDG